MLLAAAKLAPAGQHDFLTLVTYRGAFVYTQVTSEHVCAM